MPANPKHLTSSGWQRFAKISAGILGGYFVTAVFHMALALWLDHKIVLVTSMYTYFLVWSTLLIIPFLFKNGWKAWGIYFFVFMLFGVLVYYGRIINPII